MATIAEFSFGGLQQVGQTTVGKALALQIAHFFCGQRGKFAFFHFQFEIDDLLDLDQKPRIDLGQVENLLDRHADTEGIGNVPQAVRRRP